MGDTSADAQHWDTVYQQKPQDSVSWYQSDPEPSLGMIQRSAAPGASVLDVGGGASLLADRLLALGYRVGVLDISDEALRLVRTRLGARAHEVEWLAEDVRTFRSSSAWDVWHDRAVFHFLVDAVDRAAYLQALASATRPGASVVIATFGPEGPVRCSGLPTVRYSADALQKELGAEYQLEEALTQRHRTPAGGEQQFLYCRFRRATS